jgi:hypothetical protein
MRSRLHTPAPRVPVVEILRERCAAASRLAEEHAIALAAANARMLAEPGNGQARAELEDAEQLQYLAFYELRRARRALRRRERLETFLTHWTLVPWPARRR